MPLTAPVKHSRSSSSGTPMRAPSILSPSGRPVCDRNHYRFSQQQYHDQKIIGKYVTIDGSNNGTNTRNLTITNTNNNSAVVVHIGSNGTTAVQNVTIKNCNLVDGTNNDLSYTSAVSVSRQLSHWIGFDTSIISRSKTTTFKGEFGIILAVKSNRKWKWYRDQPNLMNSTAGSNAILVKEEFILKGGWGADQPGITWAI